MKNKQITEVEFNELLQGEVHYEFKDAIDYYSLMTEKHAEVGVPQTFILSNQALPALDKVYYLLDAPTANHVFSVYTSYMQQEWSIDSHDSFEAVMTQIEEHVIWCHEKMYKQEVKHLSPEIFEEHRLIHTPNTPDMTNLF